MTEGWVRDEESTRRIEERSRLSTAAIYSAGPTAKLLKFYEYRKNELVTCPHCGWTGQAGQGPSEMHRELFDVSCPRCDEMLLVVSWPTPEETREAARAGNEDAIASLPDVERREAWLARAKALELKPDSDLPDFSADRLRFTWDLLEEPDDEYWIVIRNGNQIIWRELAYWEGWQRFNKVKDILKERYGDSFVSLEPTDRSALYLFGDDLTASSKLETR